MLEDLEVFAEHTVVQERRGGLIGLRITLLNDGSVHHVEFPEPVYDVGSETNAEFTTGTYRFIYQSLVTPPSVYDYDVMTRERVLLKQTEVLGGYDPARYGRRGRSRRRRTARGSRSPSCIGSTLRATGRVHCCSAATGPTGLRTRSSSHRTA
jgi:protease II